MKFWLSKNSEVPVREQLITQIKLGIASGELKIGDRLPSTREIARRFDIHPNTVSAVYKALAELDLLAFRAGSGFYIRSVEIGNSESGHKLEKLISEFFEAAKRLGFGEKEISNKLHARLAAKPVKNILVVESDIGLRDILVHEIKSLAKCRVNAISFEDFSASPSKDALITAMFDETPKIETILLDGQKCIYLNGRSVALSMSGQSRPSPNDLIAVVSGWDGFLVMARIMLLAAKIEAGNLIVRSRKEPDWKRSIKPASIVICDSLTEKMLPASANTKTFRVISDESINELREAVQNNILS